MLLAALPKAQWEPAQPDLGAREWSSSPHGGEAIRAARRAHPQHGVESAASVTGTRVDPESPRISSTRPAGWQATV